MDKRLLTILRCPISQKGLSVLKKDRLAQVNAAIDAGELVTHDGKALREPLAQALVTDDGKRLYRVDDGIPVLLESESINLEQLA
jgi:uncharacterized protein YbaR (Trm112 family)